MMGTYIVAGALIVVVILALRGSGKHFKGEGGCCGGGGDDIKVQKKRLEGTVVAKKIIVIDGMHCDKCKSRVERALNELDGVVSKVNLKNKTAVVSMTKNVSDDILKAAVEREDYTVLGIEHLEV